ncbi:MAG: hypothetical protein EXS12_08170 [Phycisphaerales bacterium]|nr:hypothetical protein [Phycisphaerales bacterium]
MKTPCDVDLQSFNARLLNQPSSNVVTPNIFCNGRGSGGPSAIVPGAALSVNGNSFAFAYQANLGLEWQLANHLYLGFG